MTYLRTFFLSYIRPFAVLGLSFLLVGWGTVNALRYQSFVSALQQSEKIAGDVLEDVLAETDSIEDLLITFNYETIFAQPVEFQQDITAPNILYSLTAGDGISLGGDTQKPSITNTGVLTVNGLAGDVTLSAGENITLTEENGVLTIKSTDTNTDTDTKLSESEVEDFVFDGESTGSFTELEIGDILLSDEGTTATTSGSSLVGVYQGNLSEITGTNVQEIIDSIDSTLASLGTSSHGEVTFAGSLDYLTLTGQEITLNPIDLTTDVTGTIPSAQVSGVYTGLTGVGTITSGTWQGSVISATYLDSTLIQTSEIDTSAELAAIVTNETGSGALVFGTSPTLTTPNIGDASGASLNLTGTLTTGGVITGTGSGLSGLNASNLSSGTVPTARLSGSYTGITGLGTITTGTWQGSAISSTYLDSSVVLSTEIDSYSELNTLVSGVTLTHNGLFDTYAELNAIVADVTLTHNGLIDTSSEVSGIVGDETGSGSLVFGTSPTFAGNVYFPGSGIWNSTGNVGVGTTSPGATLDVQGAAQFGSGNVDLINSTGKIAAINTTYFASVDGSALTNLNASNLSSGTVPDARITGAYTGLTSLTGSGTATFASFSGNGSALTNLNATNLASGTVASARISGSYTGITGLGTISTGTWQGTDISATYLDSTLVQTTEIDTSAELAGIVTNETGSGALVFGTSPTLTTPNIGAATGTSLSVSGTVSGNGSSLTNLNATNLASGTVASARISGSYTGITGLGTISTGTWQGSAIATAYLNGSVILSTEIDTSAELAGIVTNETGSGALVFGTSPTLTTPNIGVATGTSIDLGDGTVGAPAYSFSSDTNVGMYRGGTDILRFSTAGADRLTINASGNIGVATTNPSGAKLVVNGGTGTGVSITNTGDTALGLYVLNWDDGDGIYVESGGGDGINSFAAFGDGVYGEGTNGVHGGSYYDNAIFGEALTSSAWAGYFLTPGTPAVARFQNGSGTCDVDPTSTTLICSSDARLKTNITTISSALDKILALRGVNYSWKKDSPGSPNRLGFIAQEVESIFPELVKTDAETGYKQLASSNLIAVVVNAMQEQHKIVLENKANIESANIRLNSDGEVLEVIQAQNQQFLSAQNNLLNQLNVVSDIQSEQSASTGATLQTVMDRVETIEKMTNDTDAVVTGLQDRVSQLESLFATQIATDAASLAQNTGNVLGTSDQIDLEALTVTGDANLNNLGVTGDISAGLLSIKGFDDELGTPSASISTISGPLKIQDQSAGNLEIMGGKVLIDTEGNIMVRGSITVQKLNIDEADESNKSIGEGIITAGNNEVVINTTSVTDKSKIFVTGKNVVSTPLVVVEKNPGVSFTVRIGVTAENDIPFDWLIIN